MSLQTESFLQIVAIVVMVVTAMLTLIVAAPPADLGISPLAGRWLAILLGTLGTVSGVLPPVFKYGAVKREANRLQAQQRANAEHVLQSEHDESPL